ncbi:hypothetical protein BV20DRAFT_143358 [Pilatotrama ljubarskyi]|nr:hypothetical protein BV20DRAFT_143358 [Pilatotrama ljubarskyi]
MRPCGEKMPHWARAILQMSLGRTSSHRYCKRPYTSRPDCFRRAAGLIRANCAALETSEDERVTAALSMTLCEIATAEQQSPPMECISFQIVGGDGQPRPSFGGSPGKCVEALSRSAQYWSSYSGYLREIPQLCFAFRRWNDIDVAKELHRNSTLQSLALLQHLTDREIALAQTIDQSNRLAEDMLVTLAELRSSSGAINTAADGISEQLYLAFNEVLHYLSACIARRTSSDKVEDSTLIMPSRTSS